MGAGLTAVTRDRPAPGLVVIQPERGFRYGAEAFWLVGFALEVGPRPRSAVDLGTGSGIAALLLGGVGIPCHGYDVRAEWAPLWRGTLAASSLAAPVSLAVHDVAHGVPGRCDLVVSNPPFFARGSGPVARDPWKAAARTESTATLEGFLRAALEGLAPDGRACFVVPRDRAPALVGHPLCRHVVHVGRRRTLVALWPGVGCAEETVPERGARVDAWYALAGAGQRV